MGQLGGYIVRTAAEGASAEALRADMLFLRKLWEVLTEKARLAGQGTLLHEDLPLPLRLMRDLMGEGIRVNTILPGIFHTPLLAALGTAGTAGKSDAPETARPRSPPGSGTREPESADI